MTQTILQRDIGVIVGQSNERGADKTVTIRNSEYGAPCRDPIFPKGVSGNGSWWPITVEKLMLNKGVWLRIRNAAVATTSIVQQWCGDTVGDGTGTPFNYLDAGFDPNNYFADALAEVSVVGNYVNRWAFISIGQHDSVLNVSKANYQLGLEIAVNYFLANGIKVVLGFTCFRSTAEVWYANNGNPGYLAALATFSGNSDVFQGANLYTGVGLGVQLYDGYHMDPRGYDIAGQLWYSSLSKLY